MKIAPFLRKKLTQPWRSYMARLMTEDLSRYYVFDSYLEREERKGESELVVTQFETEFMVALGGKPLPEGSINILFMTK